MESCKLPGASVIPVGAWPPNGFLVLSLSPEMTCKTGWMSVPASVGPCSVNIIKNLRLRDRWTEVNETWHAYSTGRRRKLLWKRNLEFRPPAQHGATPNLARSAETTNPDRDVCVTKLQILCFQPVLWFLCAKACNLIVLFEALLALHRKVSRKKIPAPNEGGRRPPGRPWIRHCLVWINLS